MEVIKNTLSVGATEPFVLLHISDIHLSEFDEKLKGNGILIIGDNESLTTHIRWSEKMVDSVVVYSKQ